MMYWPTGGQNQFSSPETDILIKLRSKCVDLQKGQNIIQTKCKDTIYKYDKIQSNKIQMKQNKRVPKTD